jgi:hypothetical protein
MRQYFILLGLLTILFHSSLQAQNMTVSDSSGRWKLGFNMGAAWQHGDVRALPGLGGGITLEWALVQNNHSALGLSIRGRYLSATTFGNDLTKDSVNYLNNPFLNGTKDPNMNYTAQGGVYQNYKTRLSELTFEGMLIANRLRAKHGILLYGFGGIGYTAFRVSVDQKNDATNQIYNYTSTTQTQSQLNALRDNKYETEIRKPQFALSPSFGIGLGWMLGKRVSFGFEHKLTFPTTDRLDGVVASNHYKYYGNHDMYHYTSANFTFTLGKGKSRTYSTYSNTNNYYQNNTVQPPYFNTSRPTDNPHYATDCRANILADIENINSIYDIEVYMNGTRLSSSHYFYNPSTKIFNLDIAISQTVAFSVIAKNSAGTAKKDYTFVCSPANNTPLPQPEIIIYNPTTNPANAENCYVDILAKINNIDGVNNIQVLQNNQLINFGLGVFDYNSNSKEFRLHTHINDNATFTITATNASGKAISSVAFYCKPPVITTNNVPQYVTICHIPPGDPSHPVTITINQNALQAHQAHGDHLGTCPVVSTNSMSCAGFSANVISQNNVSCNGGNNGSINVTATGGTLPYIYTWSNGAASQDVSNLTAGTYTVTVRDGNGCSTAATATVTQPSKLTVDAFGSSTCSGLNTGTATANVSGGISPYQYLWTNTLTTQSIGDLSPGIYNVTVTDARRCSANASVSINQSASLHLTVNTVNASCHGSSNGSVNLSPSGGTAPYSYNWSNGSKTQDINNLQTGSYTVMVTDSKNCSGTATALVSDPALLTVSSGVNGNSATVSASGGTAPYTYAWSNGASGSNQNNLANGSYNVTVTDANKCIATAPLSINYSPAPNCNGFAASIASQNNVKCYGAKNGSINLNVSGGTAPYKYSWNNDATTQDINNLAAGAYSVTVTDANSCKATASASVTQPIALTVSPSGTSTCPDGSTGTATVNVTGGNSPYTYTWSNGENSQTIDNLSAGNYSVIVNDATLCNSTATVTISKSAAITLNTTKTNISCNGGNNGSINLTVTNGASPYTYKWSNAATTQDINNLAAGSYSVTVTDSKKCTASITTALTEPASLNVSASINGSSATVNAYGGMPPYTYAWTGGLTGDNQTNLANGSYTVTATDANKCKASTTVVINKVVTNNPIPEVSSCNGFSAAISSQKNISCNGANDGSINVDVSSGTPPYIYSWSNGATSQDISNLSAGTFTVTVSDQHRCSATASAVITQPVLLAVKLTGTNTCPGVSGGSAIASVSGGVGPYSYKWSNGENDQTINNLSDGAYSVTVTDSKGCSANGSVTIAQSGSMTLSAAATNISCYGNTNGSISLSVTGESAPYKYKWSNGAATEDLANLAAGGYTVTVTDSKGCSASASANITAPDALTASSSSNGGNATVSANGGTSPYTYSWTGGLTGAAQSNLASGTYTVTVTDANKCTATTSITVNKEVENKCAGFSTAIGLQDNPSCNAGNDGRINLIVSMGASPFNFKWSNGATSKDLTNLTAGSYSVEVTDANNCSAKASATITEPAAFTVTATGTSSCAGSATGTATVNTSGGTGPYTYQWSNGSGDQNINNLESGTYTVTVTDANKCSATGSVNITPLGAINITSTTTNPNCHGMSNGSINITVSGGLSPYTYSWSNGAATQDINNIAAGSYTVTVKDMRSCNASISIVLSEPSAPSASSTVNESSATIAANGGTPPYTYSWTNGLSGPSQSNLQNGSYTVNVTDANNCTASATATINVVPEEKITICHKTGSGSVTIDIAASALSAHLAHGDQIGACAPAKVETPVVEETVTICHIPPGNPENPQTITIPKSALPAHLAHGDQMGTCVPKANNDGDEKITICHIPPGNPNNPQTITISKSAWPAHLAHGDHTGECVAGDIKNNNSGNNTPDPNKNNNGANQPDTTGNDANNKITICHIPPGNPNNPQTISIPRSALAAHLAHGDHIGECVAEDTKNNNSGNNTPDPNKNNDPNKTAANQPDTTGNDANNKITICHIPPGNPNNPQTISIPKSALPAHLAHGDQVGECPPQNNNSDADKQKQKALDDQAAKQKAIDDQAEKDRQQKVLDDQAEQARKQKALDDQAEQARKQKALDDQAEQVRQQKILDDQAEQARKQKELDDQAEQARKQKELDDQAAQQLKQKGIDDQAEQARKQKALDDQAERDRQQKILDDQAEQARKQKEIDDQAAQQRQQKALDDQAERDRQQKILDDQAEKDRQQKALDDQAEKDRQQKALDDQAEKDRQQKALDDQAAKQKAIDDQAEKDRQQKALDDQAEKDRQQKILDDQAAKQKAIDDQAEKDRQQKILDDQAAKQKAIDDQAEKDRQQKILDDQKKQQPDNGGKGN